MTYSRPDLIRVHLRIARFRLMRAAREADEIHATSTHGNIMAHVLAIDDTIEDFDKHMGFLQMVEDAWALEEEA